MIGCAGLVLAVAVAAFLLQMGALARTVWPYLPAAGVVMTIVFAARVGVVRGSIRLSSTAQMIFAAGVYGTGVYLLSHFGGLAMEEHLQLALLSIAIALFVSATSASAGARVAALSLLTALLMLPALAEQHRLMLIVAGAMAGAMWLFASRRAGAPRPAREWVLAGALACAIGASAVLAHHWIKPTDNDPFYAALLPTSGGDGEGTENARRGVGDGPDELSGSSPDSLGFDETDTFSESGRDGLYDLWIESYGEPVAPNESQKMVGLKPQDVKVAQAADRENLQSGRKFHMHREQPAPQHRSGDKPADALLLVRGPLPAYLPLTTFTDYDGLAWIEAAPIRPAPAARTVDGAWMEILQRPLSPAFDGNDVYQLRVGELGGRVLPLPLHTERFRMGRVNRPDFFHSTRWNGVLLAKRNLPGGTVIDVSSKHLNPGWLAGVDPAQISRSNPAELDTTHLDPAARDLAAEWGSGRERGWSQVLQVMHQLRAHAEHDRLHTIGPQRDPVTSLLADRRGTSHQFATAGVLMLRSLGYPTRLASGLVATEADTDERSGFARLTPDNVHFWCEVRIADGTWIALDATPGYPLINVPRPITARFEAARLVATEVISRHWLLALAIVSGTVLGWVMRHRLIDQLATLWWRISGASLDRTLWLIELRARLAGKPRPGSVPVGRWLDGLDQRDFARAVNHALYGGHEQAAIQSRGVIRELSLQALKRRYRGES